MIAQRVRTTRDGNRGDPMRTRWAALAAVAVVCAVPTAADGAAGVAGGVPDAGRMDKSEVQADVTGVLSGLGLVREDHMTLTLTLYAGRNSPMPKECEATWPAAWSVDPQDFPRLLSALGRDGWHRHTNTDLGGDRIASLDRGGWRLSVSGWEAARQTDFPVTSLTLSAVRLGC